MSVPHHKIKLTLIGPASVGKTAFLAQLCDSRFTPDTKVTIGADVRYFDLTLGDGTTVQLAIWDSAGQERYRANPSALYRHSAAMLLFYDITSWESFTALEDWVSEISLHVTPQPEVLLVGNKSDLEHLRAVTADQGARFAQQHEMSFIETSAASGANVREAVQLVIEAAVAAGSPPSAPAQTPLDEAVFSPLGEPIKKQAQRSCCTIL